MSDYPTVTVETECPVDPFGEPADLRRYVLGELDRILGELNQPSAKAPIGSMVLNSGRVARSLTEQLHHVVQAWPNVKVHLSFNEAYPDQTFTRETAE